MNTPSVVLPVTLLPDIETIEPPFAFSPVEFCVITLLAIRTVSPALPRTPVVENEIIMLSTLMMLSAFMV